MTAPTPPFRFRLKPRPVLASLLGAARLARLSLAVGLAPLLLQACASDEARLPCPDVVRIVDASRMVGFEGFGRDLTDVRFEAELEELRLFKMVIDRLVGAPAQKTPSIETAHSNVVRLSAYKSDLAGSPYARIRHARGPSVSQFRSSTIAPRF